MESEKDDYSFLLVLLVWALLLWAGSILVGCGLMPAKPQKGGGASVAHTPIAAPIATISQPENPAGASEQETSFERTAETVYPAESVVVTETAKPDGGKIVVTETFPAGTIRKEQTKQGTKQVIGEAQKDTARELAAKLAAYSKLQYIGVALMVFGAAGLFYAPLRVILGGGKQFPIAVAALGALLTVAPMLVAGNEGVILGGAVVVGGLAWLFIRLTRKEAEADLSR